MKAITAAQAKQIWESLIAEYVLNMFINLKRVKFGKEGKMKSDKYGAWVFHRYPNLMREFKKRIKGIE